MNREKRDGRVCFQTSIFNFDLLCIALLWSQKHNFASLAARDSKSYNHDTALKTSIIVLAFTIQEKQCYKEGACFSNHDSAKGKERPIGNHRSCSRSRSTRLSCTKERATVGENKLWLLFERDNSQSGQLTEANSMCNRCCRRRFELGKVRSLQTNLRP